MRSRIFGVAAVLAAVLCGGASAGDYPGVPLADNFVPQNTYRHYGGYDCLYTCSFGGHYRYRCQSGCRRGGHRVIVVIARDPEDIAIRRDYWKNSHAFQDAKAQFDADNGRYQRQSTWYADCGAHRWHRCPPPPN
jgi:hypothetical protein